MIPACGVVTLITDFGLHDSYVGTMKGVMLRIHPQARLIDVTHQITAQDILEASLVLDSGYRYFPVGTVHVVVVDPGVGSGRRPILVAGREHYFVGPDNGTFTGVVDGDPEACAYEIRERQFLLPSISDTFHGRDVFAPVAAFLARGVAPEEFGPPINDLRRFSIPVARVWGDQIRGEVVHVDSFGNIVSNISRTDFDRAVGERKFRILINGKTLDRIHRAYSDQERGKALALFGSNGLLEIAIAEGRAERRIGAGKGDTIIVQIED